MKFFGMCIGTSLVKSPAWEGIAAGYGGCSHE